MMTDLFTHVLDKPQLDPSKYPDEAGIETTSEDRKSPHSAKTLGWIVHYMIHHPTEAGATLDTILDGSVKRYPGGDAEHMSKEGALWLMALRSSEFHEEFNAWSLPPPVIAFVYVATLLYGAEDLSDFEVAADDDPEQFLLQIRLALFVTFPHLFVLMDDSHQAKDVTACLAAKFLKHQWSVLEKGMKSIETTSTNPHDPREGTFFGSVAHDKAPTAVFDMLMVYHTVLRPSLKSSPERLTDEAARGLLREVEAAYRLFNHQVPSDGLDYPKIHNTLVAQLKSRTAPLTIVETLRKAGGRRVNSIRQAYTLLRSWNVSRYLISYEEVAHYLRDFLYMHDVSDAFIAAMLHVAFDLDDASRLGYSVMPAATADPVDWYLQSITNMSVNSSLVSPPKLAQDAAAMRHYARGLSFASFNSLYLAAEKANKTDSSPEPNRGRGNGGGGGGNGHQGRHPTSQRGQERQNNNNSSAQGTNTIATVTSSTSPPNGNNKSDASYTMCTISAESATLSFKTRDITDRQPTCTVELGTNDGSSVPLEALLDSGATILGIRRKDVPQGCRIRPCKIRVNSVTAPAIFEEAVELQLTVDQNSRIFTAAVLPDSSPFSVILPPHAYAQLVGNSAAYLLLGRYLAPNTTPGHLPISVSVASRAVTGPPVPHIFHETWMDGVCIGDPHPLHPVDPATMRKIIDHLTALREIPVNSAIRHDDAVVKLVRNETPIRNFNLSRSYHGPKAAAIDAAHQENLANGWVVPIPMGEAKYISALHPVPKPGGEWRTCADTSYLNKFLAQLPNNLPRTDEIIADASRYTHVSQIDLSSAYMQLRLHEDSQNFVCYVHQGRAFKYTRAVFGISQVPHFFQAFMTALFADMNDFVKVYVDNIVVHTATEREQWDALEKVFARLVEHQIRINVRKLELNRRKIRILGHVVNDGVIEPCSSKVANIRDFPIPTTVKQVQGFLGLASYLRHFVLKFSDLARPLHEAIKGLSGNAPVILGSAALEAFKTIKLALSNSLALVSLRDDEERVCFSDASCDGLSFVVGAFRDGKFYISHSWSRALNSFEKNYDAHKKELCALFYGVRSAFHLLWGHHWVLYTDNSALTYPLKDEGPNAAFTRWRIYLSTFSFTINHIDGEKNVLADPLSRFLPETPPQPSLSPFEPQRVTWTGPHADEPFRSVEQAIQEDPAAAALAPPGLLSLPPELRERIPDTFLLSSSAQGAPSPTAAATASMAVHHTPHTIAVAQMSSLLRDRSSVTASKANALRAAAADTDERIDTAANTSRAGPWDPYEIADDEAEVPPSSALGSHGIVPPSAPPFTTSSRTGEPPARGPPPFPQPTALAPSSASLSSQEHSPGLPSEAPVDIEDAADSDSDDPSLYSDPDSDTEDHGSDTRLGPRSFVEVLARRRMPKLILDREQLMELSHSLSDTAWTEKQATIYAAHEGAGHGGITKTYEALIAGGYAFTRAQVAEVVDNCRCVIYKKLPAQHIPAMSQYSDRPRKAVQIDIGCPPATVGGRSDGPRVVLVIQDLYSRYVYTEPLPSKSAAVVGSAIITYFTRTGFPDNVVCDSGSEFANTFVQTLTKYDVNFTFSCADYPQGHGAVERAFGVIEGIMVRYDDTDTPWQDLLQWATMAYNTTRHSITQCVPGDVFFAHPLRHPLHPPPHVVDSPLHPDYIEHLKLVRGPYARKLAVHLRKVKTKAQNTLNNRRVLRDELKVDDLVYLQNPRVTNQHDVKRFGPFRVTATDTFGNAQLTSPGGHISRDRVSRAQLHKAPPATEWRAMRPLRVVGHRRNAESQGRDYLIEYEGYPSFCNDYVRDIDLSSLRPDLIDAYYRVSPVTASLDRGHVDNN